jgi:multisubunit Na+/H+ antiporter MnhB subunit
MIEISITLVVLTIGIILIILGFGLAFFLMRRVHPDPDLGFMCLMMITMGTGITVSVIISWFLMPFVAENIHFVV